MASLGVEMLGAVVRFIMTDYLALAVVLVLVYPLLLRTLGKVDPVRFYRNVSPAMLVSIWPVVDIGHTTCNVSGDLCGTTIIASRLKMMDVAVFNDGRTLESPSTTREHPDTNY